MMMGTSLQWLFAALVLIGVFGFAAAVSLVRLGAAHRTQRRGATRPPAFQNSTQASTHASTHATSTQAPEAPRRMRSPRSAASGATSDAPRAQRLRPRTAVGVATLAAVVPGAVVGAVPGVAPRVAASGGPGAMLGAAPLVARTSVEADADRSRRAALQALLDQGDRHAFPHDSGHRARFAIDDVGIDDASVQSGFAPTRVDAADRYEPTQFLDRAPAPFDAGALLDLAHRPR